MMSIRIILTSPHYPFLIPFHKLAAEKQQECENGPKWTQNGLKSWARNALKWLQTRLFYENDRNIIVWLP